MGSEFGEQEQEQVEGAYNIRPANETKFKGHQVKQTIATLLADCLQSKEYESEAADGWSREIAAQLTARLQDMGFERYKFVAHVLIGEQKGAGIKLTSRCSWDLDCDSLASASFESESLFCVATIFGVYHY